MKGNLVGLMLKLKWSGLCFCIVEKDAEEIPVPVTSCSSSSWDPIFQALSPSLGTRIETV